MIIFKWDKPIKNKETGAFHFHRLRIFQCSLFGIYLHYIYKADEDKHQHDHPWDFWSLVLEGSYAEFIDNRMYSRSFLSLKYNKAEFYHKLANVLGKNKRCVTLVFAGKRRRNWGYVTKSGWIDNETYRNLKKEGKLPD